MDVCFGKAFSGRAVIVWLYRFQRWILSSVSSHKEQGTLPPQQNICPATQLHYQNRVGRSAESNAIY